MAAATARTLIGASRSGCAAVVSAVLLCSLPLPSAADAESVYKYRGVDGHWVYSDRQPQGQSRRTPLNETPAAIAAGVALREVTNVDGKAVLVAANGFPGWVQVAYRVESSRNLDPAAPSSGNLLVPPRDQTFLMALAPIDASFPVEVSFSYQYLHGHPGTRHRPDTPYMLPFAPASAHRVSQAYPDVMTHATAATRHAIDFEMPVGTAVLAAREGIVIETAEEFSGSGLDLEVDGDQANFVRILHDDGTLALYGHLNRHSIRVEPGERVARGEYIADSGNTGFSSGPHLHFVVQRNRAGAMESVPVHFAGAAGSVVTLATGDRPVAY
jgi:murein DD-endopeptidase MepM/ murein hydrolase activator NlpD